MSRLRFISLLLPLALLGASCGKGRSVLLVTVTNSGAAIDGIQQFSVLVTSGGKTAGPYSITPPGAPVPIPPARQFSLSFEAAISGRVTVGVQAIGAGGVSVAGGSATEMLTPSQQAMMTVQLVPGAVPSGSYALRSSSIGTAGPADHSGQYRVLDDGFEFGDHTCAGATCVTGGITP